MTTDKKLTCKRCGGTLYAWAHECPADYCDPAVGAAVPFVALDEDDKRDLATIDAAMKLEQAKAKLAIALTALAWYADPKNNGKREFGEINDVSVARWREIDDDEGEVAREALDKMKDM